MKLNALILAAGFGKRLAPLTEHMPKPVLPIGGVPLLHLVINKLKYAGVEEIAINTHYLPELIKECAAVSGFAGDITVFHEKELLDTAGPLVNAGELLRDCDHFLLHNGDVYTDFDISPMIEQHIAGDAVMTMAVLKGPENRIHIQDDRIVDIKELLGVPYTDKSEKYTYACVAVCSKEIFRFLPSGPIPCHFYDVWTKILQTGARIGYYRIPDGSVWNDIGSCPQYFAANYTAAGGGTLLAAGAEVAESAVVTGFNVIGSGAKVAPGAKLHNCIVLDGAEVPPARWANQIIGRDFVCHRDERELRSLGIFGGKTEGLEFSSLEEQGSSRRFYRVGKGDGSRILMLSDASDRDFGHFMKLGDFFSRYKMLTPEIFAADTDEYSVLMEDLGDKVLYRLLQNCSSKELLAYYRKVLQALVYFQEQGRAAIADADMEYRLFNRKILIWESEYFIENFLLKLCGLTPDVETMAALRRETRSIALAAEKMPVAVMHRDFQSQNIVLKDGAVRFVDFQGSRLGPYTYDAASLIKDPYMALPGTVRAELYDIFYQELAATGFVPSPDDFRRDCLLGALQRNMQALGAYGFLTLEKGKKHYLQYVPACLEFLQEGIKDFAGLNITPVFVLQKLCMEAADKYNQERDK